MKHVIPVGTSEPQDFELRDRGEPINGTGLTVTLEIYARGEDAPLTVPPGVAWLSQSAGTVRVTGVAELEAGSYQVRFKLTDGTLEVGYVPNGEHSDLWQVVPIGNR